MRELGPGLRHSEALHPEWEGIVRRGQLVSYATDDGGFLLPFDPIAPSLVERFGWPANELDAPSGLAIFSLGPPG